MRFKTYDEVDPAKAATLSLAGFGWNLDASTVKKLRRLDPNCSDWFAMYAVEGDEILAQAGASYPHIETTKGTMKLGYVWGVTTSPDNAKKGIARKLMEKVQDQMRDDGVEIFALSTAKSLVAYNLYTSLGYLDLQEYCWAKREGRKSPHSDIKTIVRKHDNEQTFKLYNEASKGALGFVHRHRNFVKPRCLWFPYVSRVYTFMREDEAIGYALVNEGKQNLSIKEMTCPDLKDVPDCVAAMERKQPRKHTYCSVHGREDTTTALGKAGLAPTMNSYGTLMMRKAKGRLTHQALMALTGKDQGRFQFTSTDEY